MKMDVNTGSARRRAPASLAVARAGVLAALSMAAVASVAAPSHAEAGHLVGNGGGAWVCRNPDSPEIRWAMVVDVFEARAQFPLDDFTGLDAAAIVARVGAKLREVDPWLAQAFRSRYLRVREQWVPVTGMELEVIDDALYYGKPAPETCLLGDLSYGQVVNFYPDGRVFADTRLIEVLDETNRAALYVHEALYLLFREAFGDTDSLRTRKTVSLLFSTKPADELRIHLDWYRPLAYVPVAEPRFESLGAFAGGLAPASLAGRWGYVTATTRWAVPNRYLDARPFSGGLGAVRTAKGWGFVDSKGNTVVPHAFEDVSGFAGGLAAARKGDLWGFIDATGAWTLETRYLSLTAFSTDGLAIARTLEDAGKERLALVDGLANVKTFIPGVSARAFVEGVAAVEGEDGWRYVDTHGRTLHGGYEAASDYRGGKAIVVERGGRKAVIDVSGAVIETGSWQAAFLGSDGRLVSCDASACGFTTAGGERATFPTGDELRGGFEDGLAVFVRKGLAGFYAIVESGIDPTR